MQLSPGDRVQSYEIVGVIGAGGMGSVYRARDSRLGRDIAIKILQDRLLSSPEHLSRFAQEARSASALNHPNIVTIHDIGEFQGAPFIAMEFIEGQRLRDLMKDGPLPMKRLLALITQVADGLATAHDRGIVHRDLKPENLMITADGLAKIVDFGLARLREEPPREDASTSEVLGSQTREGAVVGTAAYMSPEQASGKSVDFRSDQFSLGSILYEMATGRRPFLRSSALDTLSAIVHEDPEPVERWNPRVPLPLRWTIQRCLAKDPRDRYASTRDLARDLQTIRDHLTETTTGETLKKIGLPLRRRQTALFAAAAIVVAGAAIFLADRLRTGTIPQAAAQPVPMRLTMAIMPFEDLSIETAGENFSRGFSAMVSNQLSKAPSIQVIHPDETAAAYALGSGISDLAKRLHAHRILKASTERSGSELRINYSILDPFGRLIGGDTLTGPAEPLFPRQDQLVQSVFEKLRIKPPASLQEKELVSGPDQEQYVRALGHLAKYQDPKEVASATELLEDLVKRLPDATLALAALARAYLAQYDLTQQSEWAQKAITTAERAATIDPSRPEVHIALGEAYRFTGKNEEAIQHSRRALEIQPDSAEANRVLGVALQQSGDYAGAETAFLRAVELQPGMWSSYNRLGALAMTRGRYAPARDYFRKALGNYPNNVRAWSNLGAAEFTLGNFDQAQKSYAKAVALGPDAPTLTNLASCYYYLGRHEDAVKTNRAALEKVPDSSLYWANLGDAQRALGRDKESRAAYAKAIEFGLRDLGVNESSGRTHGTLARCYAKTGNHQLAQKHIARALQLEPEEPARMVQAAMVANLSGNETEAAAWLKKALEAGFLRALVDREPDFENLRRKNLLEPAS